MSARADQNAAFLDRFLESFRKIPAHRHGAALRAVERVAGRCDYITILRLARREMAEADAAHEAAKPKRRRKPA